MPKKSKSKPRTNWKARALHCEEVIGVLNSLSATTLARAQKAESVLDESGKKVNALRFRADNAEKRVQELEGVNARCETCDSPLSTELGRIRRFCHNGKCAPTTFPTSNPPTHWQRFKSWLSRRGK